MRSIVYHQTAGKYTLTSDDIQPKGLMRYTLKRDDIRMYISPQASYTFNDIPSLRLGYKNTAENVSFSAVFFGGEGEIDRQPPTRKHSRLGRVRAARPRRSLFSPFSPSL